MPYMYALYACPIQSALFVCLICMPYSMYVCMCLCPLNRSAFPPGPVSIILSPFLSPFVGVSLSMSVHRAKESYVYGKSDLCIRQKRPAQCLGCCHLTLDIRYIAFGHTIHCIPSYFRQHFLHFGPYSGRGSASICPPQPPPPAPPRTLSLLPACLKGKSERLGRLGVCATQRLALSGSSFR